MAGFLVLPSPKIVDGGVSNLPSTKTEHTMGGSTRWVAWRGGRQKRELSEQDIDGKICPLTDRPHCPSKNRSRVTSGT